MPKLINLGNAVYKISFIIFFASFLSGCVTTDLSSRSDLPEQLRQTTIEMRLRATNQCTTHRYDPTSGKKLTGDIKIATEVSLRRLYVSDGDWFKAEMIGNGVIDNVFYSPKTGKFVCGQKTWDTYADTKNIVFKEYGVSEKTINPIGSNDKTSEIPKPQNPQPNIDARSIAVSWEGYEKLISGTVHMAPNQKTVGIFKISLPNGDGNCSGQSKQVNLSTGVWSISCTNGMSAAGTYEAYGDGKGASGVGTDTKGKQVKYSIAPRN